MNKKDDKGKEFEVGKEKDLDIDELEGESSDSVEIRSFDEDED